MHQSLWGANIFTSPECYHVSRHSVQIHTHRCVPYDDSSWSQRNYCELAPALPVSCCYFCKETASVQSLFFLHFRFICRLQNTLYTCILGEMRQMDSDIWSAIRDLDNESGLNRFWILFRFRKTWFLLKLLCYFCNLNYKQPSVHKKHTLSFVDDITWRQLES